MKFSNGIQFCSRTLSSWFLHKKTAGVVLTWQIAVISLRWSWFDFNEDFWSLSLSWCTKVAEWTLQGRFWEEKQGRNSWGARGACAPPPPKKKNFDFSFQRERGKIIASQRRLLIAGLEEPKITFASCFNWNVKGKTQKKNAKEHL